MPISKVANCQLAEVEHGNHVRPGECDFIAVRRHAVSIAVQACVELHSEDVAREIKGLRSAMSRFELSEGWVVTLDQSDEYTVPEGAIHVVPFAEFGGRVHHP